MRNLALAFASMLTAAVPTLDALTPPPPDAVESQVSQEEMAFAGRFIPVFVSGYAALRRGDAEQLQRAVLAGRAAGFQKDLTSPLGGLTMEVPGLRGENTFRWLWTCLEECAFPTRDFS